MHNIIFDYDGTLHETSYIYYQAFTKAYDYLVENNYMPERKFKVEEVTKWLGYNKYEMWSSFAPNLEQDIVDTVSNMIGDEMLNLIKNHKAKLYPGVIELLENLKKDGRKLFILSNCKNSYMDAHRQEFKLDRYIDEYFCAEAYDFISKEEIFESIENKYPGPFIIVGDRFHDIKVATEHNLISIGTSYGFGEKEELKDASYIASSPREIYEIIENIEK